MIRAVRQCYRDIDDRKAERTFSQIIANADLDRRNEVPRNGAARDRFIEYNAGTSRQWLDVELDVAELTMPAGLLLVACADLGPRSDRLFVADAALLAQNIYAELAHQAFERHAQMHLALAVQQNLMHLGVVLERQRWVFIDEFAGGGRQLHLVLAILEPETDCQHGLGRLQNIDLRNRHLADRNRLTGMDGIETS